MSVSLLKIFKIPMRLVTLTVMLIATVSLPEQAYSAAMVFSHGGVDQPCRADNCVAWINAKGEITSESAEDFISYLKNNPYAPRIVRFDSPGGSLRGGVELGEAIRNRGYSTEATYCASSCTYAFMGGVERSLVGDDALIGVHRFYQDDAVFSPSTKQFTGDDLDATQRVMAGLMLYGFEMGIDLRLIAMTAEAGPGEMRWLSQQEAADLKLTYQPNKWLPWRVEGDADNDAFIAISETQDGSKNMQLTCARGNAYFSLLDDMNESWFNQCARVAERGHPVLGLRVPNSNVDVQPWHDGGAIITFALPKGTLDFNKPSLFSMMGTYPMSCLDSDGTYTGTTDKLRTMATLVLSMCNR